MFVIKAKSQPQSGEPGGLPGTNNLAYYKRLQIMTVESFITLSPGACSIKLFTVVIYGFSK